jgi:carbon starvation protein
VQGIRDPLGGINSLWPLFGIANQMLAAIALCLATTIILKIQLLSAPKAGKPALALITLVPLVWLLTVTMTAGVEKIFHPDPRIGFLAQAKVLKAKIADCRVAVAASPPGPEYEQASQEMKTGTRLYANQVVDAIVAAVFLACVSVITLLSVREWILLLGRKKPARLRETQPVWLPGYAVAEGGRNFNGVAGAAALAVALAKELSNEAALERAQHQACVSSRACKSEDAPRTRVHGCAQSAPQLYVEVTEQRFSGVRRCC